MITGNGTSLGSAFRVERRQDVAVIWFDVPGEPVNTLKADFGPQLEAVLLDLESAADVRAVVLASAKEGNFVAGADIHMLNDVGSAADGTRLSRQGQATMNRIASFPKPIVAAIDGACLGGGLELALACSERVVSTHRKTKLGLPEVQLGLLPGAGGTQRLVKQIGVQQALDLLLTGKQVDARKARKLGLADDVAPSSIVVDVAEQRARALAQRDTERPSKPAHWLDKDHLEKLALADNPLGRKILFDQALKRTLAKTHGNYPAPERILEVVKTGLAKGMTTGLEAEARAFGELLVTPEARELIYLFLASQSLKKDSGVDDASVKPRKAQRVGILGAGLMGAGVAYVTAAQADVDARIKDKDDEGVLRGLRSIRELVNERVKRKRMTRTEADRLMNRITGTTTYAGFSAVDVVIEAVFEDLELKHRVLQDIEKVAGKEVIFASNTSSLPISEIAEASAHPETVIGMHYFSPVHKMPLLEIITTEKTAPWVVATCVELGKRQGKTVIVVRDGVGFYTTRVLVPFMNEAAKIVGEGVPIEVVDEALVRFGFPVGPIKLTDEVGIDVGVKVGKILEKAFGERMARADSLDAVLADGRLGRKNKRGFYLYGEEKGVDPSIYELLGVEPTNRSVSQEEIARRCTLQMVNEAAHCYGEGILRSARDGDIGAVFGLGFPPFRGGPFRYVDAVGPQEIVRRLEAYRDRFGKRFTPAPALVELANRGARFHSDDAPPPGSATSPDDGQPSTQSATISG